MSTNQDWVTLLNSRKYHYCIGSRALCGKYLYVGNEYDPDNGKPSKDDCAECRKRLDKITAENAKLLSARVQQNPHEHRAGLPANLVP
jgi:hypothetical protein